MLVSGSRLFVAGAVDLARLFSISDAVIGLTLSPPAPACRNCASSLMAAWRKQPDIAIGNVVGSNIYNILAILGVSGMIASPVNGQGVSLTDTLIMIGFSSCC